MFSLLSRVWGALFSHGSEQQSLSSAHQVPQKASEHLSSVLEDVIPRYYPSIPHDTGDRTKCSCEKSILCIPAYLPENDFRCYLLAVTETNTSLSDRAALGPELSQAM